MPDRLQFALAELDLAPGDRVLEIGCGTGVLAALVVGRLATGRYLGIDRSPVAVSRTTRRLNGSSGEIRLATLGDLGDEAPGSFDKVVAVNVNLFWTTAAASELDQLRRLLTPGGRLLLVYEAPGDPDRLLAPLIANLDRAGWTHHVAIPNDGARLVGVDCWPAPASGL